MTAGISGVTIVVLVVSFLQVWLDIDGKIYAQYSSITW